MKNAARIIVASFDPGNRTWRDMPRINQLWAVALVLLLFGIFAYALIPDSIVQYFTIVAQCDGPMNDWLTHMPPALRQPIHTIGLSVERLFAC